MSGAVRSVILQHFAKGGTLPPGKDPDFGDISLKESNQDKAGKIVGLCVGVALLLGFIGIGSGVKAEATSLERSLEWFLVLTIVHLLGNIQAVRQLEIAQDQSAAGDKIRNVKQDHERKHILWEMFLPKGYPHTVVDSYTSFRAWSLLNVIIGYPKQIVTSMLFWGNVYGVGNSGSSPVTAVLIDIFMATVDCVVGLLSGLPIMAKLFNYSDKKWYYISGTIGRCAEFVQLAAILAPSGYFYPLIVIARTMQAFSSTASSRIGGAIPPALMKRECADRKEIELIHVNVSAGNQDKAISLPSGMLSIAFLYYMAISFMSLYGCYMNMPLLPGDRLGTPLLPRVGSDRFWEEQNDLDSEVSNAFSGPASVKPVLVRSSSRG